MPLHISDLNKLMACISKIWLNSYQKIEKCLYKMINIIMLLWGNSSVDLKL